MVGQDNYVTPFEEPRATHNSYKEGKIVSNWTRKERRKEVPYILVSVLCIYLALQHSTQWRLCSATWGYSFAIILGALADCVLPFLKLKRRLYKEASRES